MKKIITTTLLALIALNLNAATFLFDDLTTGYVDGNLVGQNRWTQTSTASNNPIQYSGSKVIVGPTGQDVWKSLSTQIVKANVSTVYTRIDFSVVTAKATGDYFFSLSDPAGSTSNFYQRLFVRASGSGLNIGLQSTSGTGALTVWGSSVYNLNELLSVVIAWDMVTGTLNDTFNVYVNPLTDDRSLLTAEIASNWNSTTGSEPALNISALNLRQGSATTASTVYVEELWVGNSLTDVGISIIPEPDSWMLIVIGFVFLGLMKTKTKTKASLLAALLAVFSINTTHAAVLGIESASNYTSATWTEGAGSSVGNWYFQNDTAAVTQIADSSQGGRTSIGTDAFNFVPGNTAFNQFANGWFVLNGGGLIAGQTLSVDANYLWSGGNRGVEFMSGNAAVFRLQHVWSDPITFAGTGLTDTQVLANGYQQALTYSVDQLDQLSVQVSAYLYGSSSALFTQTVAVPDYITGIHFYAGDVTTTTADQPNYGLFVNNIEVSGIPEPSAGSLMLLGGAALIVLKKLKRKEVTT
jgi:hypothetical protein